MRMARTLALLCALLAGAAASAQERVSFPSLDGAGNAPLVLTALWFPVAASPAPAVALFHGCGGAFDRRGALSRRMREYAALFNRAGYHVLIVDSLTPRYETELCTQRVGRRRVTQSATKVPTSSPVGTGRPIMAAC